MRQYDDKLFQVMLMIARNSPLNNHNFAILNNKLVAMISILNLNE